MRVFVAERGVPSPEGPGVSHTSFIFYTIKQNYIALQSKAHTFCTHG